MSRREERERLVYEVVRRHERGESIRQIHRVLGIARKTIRKILQEQEQRRANGDDIMVREGPRPRTPRPSKLDRHLGVVSELLERYPDITAQRMYEELCGRGFDGCYSTVRDHIRRRRPKPARRAHDPVHTPPGKQAQIDWSPYVLETREDIEAFSAVLHYSRFQHADFSDNRRRPTLFRHLIRSFDAFSGVPEELVFDSEKTVVDRWELGVPIINLTMLDFAAYYRTGVHIAPRGDGAYKGVVERPFWFMETNFFNGRTFHSLDEVRETMVWWLKNKVNCRHHRTTQRQPVELLTEEQPHLKALPPHPYDASEMAWRIADGYHRVEFETNTYTVPRKYVGQRLCVRAMETRVEIYDGYAKLLATHERCPRGAREHRELPEHRMRKRIDIDKVLQRYETMGETAAVFANRLRQQQRYAGLQLTKILALQSRYRLEDILEAIEQALSYHVYKACAVERILQVRAKPLLLQDVVAERIRNEIRRTLVKTPVRQRTLDDYQVLLTETSDRCSDGFSASAADKEDNNESEETNTKPPPSTTT